MLIQLQEEFDTYFRPPNNTCHKKFGVSSEVYYIYIKQWSLQ